MSDLTKSELQEILAIGRLAPSVHNSQPWKVRAHKNTLIVTLDPENVVIHGDPTGRQTYLSLGIFIEALLLGAAHAGYKEKQVQLEKNMVTISLTPIGKPSGETLKSISYLKTRATDRSIYKRIPLPTNLERKLKNCISDTNVDIKLIRDKTTLSAIATYTAKGIKLALSSPEFRKELSRYLANPSSNAKRGISTKSLYLPPLVAALQPVVIKHMPISNQESVLEKKRWLSASGIVILTAKGDMPRFWFLAGRHYLKVSLVIEAAGLSQATSAAIVEAADFHEDVERMINTKQRILAVIRVGKGAKKRHYSPRVSAEGLTLR